jgi:hypothetical protein
MFEEKYGDLTHDEQKSVAEELMKSLRGQLIISQALFLAKKELLSGPKHQQEPSNAADMELLLRTFFPLYPTIDAANEQMRTMKEKEGGAIP